MTYRFRKKTLFLCLVVVVLEYCSGEESGSFENVTSSIDFGDDKNEKSVSQQSSEMFMPGKHYYLKNIIGIANLIIKIYGILYNSKCSPYF